MNYLENRNHIQPKRKHFSKELCHHYPLLSNIVMVFSATFNNFSAIYMYNNIFNILHKKCDERPPP